MTMALYNIGDEFEVISSFKFEGKSFATSRKGIVKEIIDDDWTKEIRYYTQWDFKDPGFHDCGGHCTYGYGWCVDSIVLERHTQLILDTSSSANPLPEDPRLRGIALKIIQLEKKFKRKQEAKRSLANV